MTYLFLLLCFVSYRSQQFDHLQDRFGQRDSGYGWQWEARFQPSESCLHFVSHLVSQRSLVLPFFNGQFYSQLPQLLLCFMFSEEPALQQATESDDEPADDSSKEAKQSGVTSDVAGSHEIPAIAYLLMGFCVGAFLVRLGFWTAERLIIAGLSGGKPFYCTIHPARMCFIAH